MVDVVDPEIGDHLVCSACNVKLQVISKMGKPGERQFIICPGCGIELEISPNDPPIAH
jgi:hypothetical protein